MSFSYHLEGALCHCQGPLLPAKDNTPFVCPIVLSQYNPFARIYCHVYEIFNNHENSNINREDRSNNNDSTESGSSHIIINSSMKMRLTEGDDRRTHKLPTMEEIAAAIPIEYSYRNFRDITP